MTTNATILTNLRGMELVMVAHSQAPFLRRSPVSRMASMSSRVKQSRVLCRLSRQAIARSLSPGAVKVWMTM